VYDHSKTGTRVSCSSTQLGDNGTMAVLAWRSESDDQEPLPLASVTPVAVPLLLLWNVTPPAARTSNWFGPDELIPPLPSLHMNELLSGPPLLVVLTVAPVPPAKLFAPPAVFVLPTATALLPPGVALFSPAALLNPDVSELSP
jgi:hypothetical protein